MTALMNVAKNAGAYNLLITAQPESSAGRLADSMIVMPAQTIASDQGEAKKFRPAHGLGLRGRPLRSVRGDGAEAEDAARRVA
jgi:D-arabinose 5-phosphate isomerase GutQ